MLTGVRNRSEPSRMSPNTIPDRSPGPTTARSWFSKSEIVSFSVTLTAGSIFFGFFPGRAHQNPSNPRFQHVFTRPKKIVESIGDVYKTGEALKQPSQALYIYISIIELDIPFLKTIVDLQQSNVMRLRRDNSKQFH